MALAFFRSGQLTRVQQANSGGGVPVKRKLNGTAEIKDLRCFVCVVSTPPHVLQRAAAGVTRDDSSKHKMANHQVARRNLIAGPGLPRVATSGLLGGCGTVWAGQVKHIVYCTRSQDTPPAHQSLRVSSWPTLQYNIFDK